MPGRNSRKLPAIWVRALVAVLGAVPLALAVSAASGALSSLYASAARDVARASLGRASGLEAAQIALRLAPWRASAHAVLAQSWSAEGRFETAIVHAREAVQGRPGDGYMWQYLARLESARGNPKDEALAFYRMALRRSANAAPLHRAIAIDGVRHWRFGDTELRQLWRDSMRYSLQHERRQFLKEVAALRRDPYWCAAHRDALPIAQWCARAARIRERCAQEGLPEDARRWCRDVGLRGAEP